MLKNIYWIRHRYIQTIYWVKLRSIQTKKKIIVRFLILWSSFECQDPIYSCLLANCFHKPTNHKLFSLNNSTFINETLNCKMSELYLMKTNFFFK